LSTCGTHGYRVSEIYGLIKRESVYATDIWALGEIVFELLTRKPTFKHIGMLVNYNEHPDTYPSDELANVKVSSLGIGFVHALMHPQPAERLTAPSALSYRWIMRKTETGNMPMAIDPPDTSIKEKTELSTGGRFAAWSTMSIRPKKKTQYLVSGRGSSFE
jgi:serine/threonine protein kinase